jgi:hypothetical protein
MQQTSTDPGLACIFQILGLIGLVLAFCVLYLVIRSAVREGILQAWVIRAKTEAQLKAERKPVALPPAPAAPTSASPGSVPPAASGTRRTAEDRRAP